MIISSLCEYYGYMAKNGKVNKAGYVQVPINYVICLSEDGTINDIISFNGKEGRKFCFPGRGGREPKTEAKPLEYRAKYIFGLNYDKGKLTTEDPTDNAKNSHKAFIESHINFTEGMQSPLVQAFRKFMQNWNPELETENKYLLELGGNYNKNFAFCLSGKINDYLQDEKEIKEKWEKEFVQSAALDGVPQAICPIYGKKLPVAEKHYPISAKGVLNGRAVICYNNETEESYGKKKSYNSGISVRAMQEYTEALDYLLESPNHHTVLGDVTVGYFALTEKQEDDYANAISFSFNFSIPPSDGVKEENAKEKVTDAEEVNDNLNSVAQEVKTGKVINFSYFDGLDESVRYCIFGYAPIGKGRAALKFFYTDSFGVFRKNIEQWHNDFAVGDSRNAPSFKKICFQLIKGENKKVDDEKKNKSDFDREKEKKLYSELTECLLTSAINAVPLPEKILETVIRRIKTDSDGEKSHSTKMNDTRIGLLKACLNRKNKGRKEEITVSLNLENKNPAYLCGRLFAALERAQMDAATKRFTEENFGKEDKTEETSKEKPLEKTIKDSYFSAAMSTPRTIFSVLIKLNTHHMAKLKPSRKIYLDKIIGSIMNDLEEFPKTLSLEQQGNFIIGYYQQNKDLYTAKADKEEL